MLLLTLASGCKTRTLRYAASEDLTVGSYTVKLYTNGECEVEMGIGYHKGHYIVNGDTVRLVYRDGSPEGMPTRLLLTPNFLVAIPTVAYPYPTKIRRWQEL
jgi:hypothetical protein